MTDLRTLNKTKLLTLLDTEVVTLLEIARITLDSWSMRMQIELKTGMTESRLEDLARFIDGVSTNAAEGGAPPRPSVYSNDFHADESTPPKFAAE